MPGESCRSPREMQSYPGHICRTLLDRQLWT